MRRLVLLLVLALGAGWLVGPARPAVACSCASIDARDGLAVADGAFSGTVEHVDRDPGNGSGFVRFRVEQVHKGEFPPVVDVHPAVCGLGGRVGERYGLLLRREGGRWTSHSCATLDPTDLARVAQPFPEPDGAGQPAVVVGSTYGPGRLVTLDGSGRPITFGAGAGSTAFLGFCPGGKRFAEVYNPPYEESNGIRRLALWNLDTLTVEWTTPLRWSDPGDDRNVAVEAVACTDPSGERVRLLTYRYNAHDPATDPDGWRYGTVGVRDVDRHGDGPFRWEGPGVTGGAFAADGTRAYVASTPRGRDLLAVDLSSTNGVRTEVVAKLPPGAGALVVSPEGSHLAAVAENRAWEQREGPVDRRLVTVDLTDRSVHEHNLGQADDAHGQAAWVDDDHLAFLSYGKVRVFDARLRLQRSWTGITSGFGYGISPVTAPGGLLVSLNRGVVRTAPGATGPFTDWAELEDAQPQAIALVPGGAPIGPSAEPAAATTTTRSTPPAGTPQSSPPEVPEEVSVDGFEAQVPAAGSGGGGGWLAGGGAAVSVGAAAAAMLLRRRRRTVVDLL